MLITRFAPSPTGHLHVGGARSAMFCWAFAKANGGRFMLRIEDTDAARSSDESARGIMEDLAWLGIEWDDGPALTLADGRVIGAKARAIEGGYFQARRVAIYNREVERLVRAGRAYPAFDTNEETEAQRKAAAAAKQTYRYPRPADVTPGVFNAERWERAQRGERHVVRFVAPHQTIVVKDQVLGDVTLAAGELDDFVIRKADLFPTYHFAVVVDDELMGVTHVLRAQEHLANTPRHVALQQALGFASPVYAHMPLIFNIDGTKMSKRDKAKAARAAMQERLKATGASIAALAQQVGLEERVLAAFLAKENDSLEVAEKAAKALGIALPEIEVADFRAAGYLPEAINNFLGLLGWNPGMKLADGKDLEKFDLAFIAKHFAIDRIGKTNAKFDRKKLLSFNGDYIAGLSDEEFYRRWLVWLEEQHAGSAALAKVKAVSEEARPWLVRAIKTRTKIFGDTLPALAWLLRADDAGEFDAAAAEKNLRANSGAGLALLKEFAQGLRTPGGPRSWTPEAIHGYIEDFAKARGFVTDKGVNVGPIAQPVRVAIAGVPVTPPLGETLAVLGRESTLARLDRCIAAHS